MKNSNVALFGTLLGGVGALISLFTPIGDTGHNLWEFMNHPFFRL